MAVVSNFYISIFLRLAWEFLGLESKREGFVCWPNNKIIDRLCWVRPNLHIGSIRSPTLKGTNQLTISQIGDGHGRQDRQVLRCRGFLLLRRREHPLVRPRRHCRTWRTDSLSTSPHPLSTTTLVAY